MSMADIFLKNVRVKYRHGAIACAALNFSLKPGDRLAVVGDVASGKSTLLKLLAGLVERESGEFSINGKDASCVSVKDRDAMFIQDRLSLFNMRSVEYNLTYPLRIRGEKGAQLKDRAKHAASAIGITVGIETPVYRLSKEDKIKLCYARLFMRSADLYLIDDLYKELSEEGRAELFDRILEWSNEKNKTVVLATENLQDALRFSNRVLLMSYGVQIAEGNVSDISENIPSVWVYKTLFPENELIKARISRYNDSIVLDIGDKQYTLDERLLLDELFVEKNVVAGIADDRILIYDCKSENLIYPIKQ